MINRINRQKLEQKKIKLVLRKQCSTSWLEIELPAKDDSVRASETNPNNSSYKLDKRVVVVEDEEN